jgi:hypothetical protein
VARVQQGNPKLVQQQFDTLADCKLSTRCNHASIFCGYEEIRLVAAKHQAMLKVRILLYAETLHLSLTVPSLERIGRDPGILARLLRSHVD